MTPETQAATKEAAAAPKRNGKKMRIIGGATFAALLLAEGYWLYSHNRESTDDAFIDAHIIPISAKVQGQVLEVNVEDNQEVKQGDPLVVIDPDDFKVRLNQVRAELEAAKAEERRAGTDAERAKKLFHEDQISRQDYDHAVAAADVAGAQRELASQKAAAAELDLSYTRVTSPEAGRVTHKDVEIQSYVQVGQPLMAIVPKNFWVTANFKETQIARMHPGQPVDIRIDTYRGHVFRGHVDSIQAGTGARFSLLPPENATGNYVKVVQRVPVKIVFDEPTDGYNLVPGMSVEPVVKLK